jgi:uncharacterized protein
VSVWNYSVQDKVMPRVILTDLVGIQAMVIGTDVPDITASILSKAEALLDRNDVVFGPAQDGGFYLLGVKRQLPRLFDSITWSTDSVLKDCCAVVKEQAGLQVADIFLMEVLLDIDTIQVMC